MSSERETWTPERVLALQAAYRSADPLMTDEKFAQDILSVAPRSLYLWKQRPGIRLRPGTQRALDAALESAPPVVVARYREAMASVLDRPGPQPGDMGTYQLQLVDALTSLVAIANHDGNGIPYVPDNLAPAVLDWLSSPRLGRPGSLSVGDHDIEHVRTTTQALDAIERTIGGPGCRQAATHFLHDVALPMLDAQQQEIVRTELFSAVAELCELVGWMAYDAGEHGVAQAYFTHALRLTRESGDDALAAYLMTSLTHQALFVGHPRHALRLSRTAADLAAGTQEFQVVAEAELLSARALAQLGQGSDGTAALGRAEQAFERRANTSARSWVAQWDETIFASHAATTWLRLGHTGEARRLMQRVWDASATHPRRRIYAGAELGIAAVRDGDLDDAVQITRSILPIASNSDSRRARHHIGRLVDELRPHSSTIIVRHVLDELGNLPTEGSQA